MHQLRRFPAPAVAIVCAARTHELVRTHRRPPSRHSLDHARP